MFIFFSAAFCITFVSDGIATSMNKQVLPLLLLLLLLLLLFGLKALGVPTHLFPYRERSE
jgi:hypothetical protein